MRDENGLRRQWMLLRALTSRRLGLSIREMAEEFQVTQRTIRRDLDAFRSVGFPVEQTSGEFGRKAWSIKPGRDQPPLSFNYDEAIALHLGRRMLGPLAGTPFGEAAEGAFKKIRAALGAGALEYLEQFSTLFHDTGVGRRDYAAKSDSIDALRSAAEDRKEVRLLYRSESEVEAARRDVHPYGVVHHRGSLYLIALDPAQGRIKHYKVDRVEEVEILDRAFERRENFDLADHMASAFGVYREGEPVVVEVRFAASAARYVQEARWHESQELVPQADGGVLARFTVSGTEEIKRWLLGFGAKAEILSPEGLRREVVEELQTMLATYTVHLDSLTTRSGGPNEDAPSE
jgi:proteasome accessory factor B